jgi:hypothetical protein
MIWNLRDCRMVGSVCSLRSSAPFSRDAVVLTNEKHPDTHMIRGREYADGSVEGERMTEAEWRDLLECEEALAFSEPVEARPNAKCWLLHETFPEREQAAGQLRTCTGAILHEEARDGVLIFVVDELRAADRLERWSREAFDRAWRLGQCGVWDRAVAYADLAWLTDRSLNLDRVALLALALEQAQGASAAEDLIAFELNSRVGRPERELRKLIAAYRLQFYVSRRIATSLAARMHELQSRNSIGDIARWKAERAKTDRVFPFPRAATPPRLPRSPR